MCNGLKLGVGLMTGDFTKISEHTVRAALESENEDNPIVMEVTDLMRGYVKRMEKYRDYGEDPAQALVITAATAPIEAVAKELLAQMLEE